MKEIVIVIHRNASGQLRVTPLAQPVVSTANNGISVKYGNANMLTSPRLVRIELMAFDPRT